MNVAEEVQTINNDFFIFKPRRDLRIYFCASYNYWHVIRHKMLELTFIIYILTYICYIAF